jgi:SAM-dependent methyltransferase
MNDCVGKYLARWRIGTVIPHLRGKTLDVGCGNNRLILAYKKCGGAKESLGIDVYPWDGVDLVIEDAGSLPFVDESFDTVCCIAALNHIPERERFLAEGFRILQPGGRFIMTMIPPFISRIWHTLRSPWDDDQRERGMKPGEVYGLGKPEVFVLLRKAGFASVEEKPFMVGINHLYITKK